MSEPLEPTGATPREDLAAPLTGRPVRPRPAAILALVLAAIGAVLAIILVREHLTVTEGGLARGFLCGGAGRFDCNQVASHEASWLLGSPLALWGLAFYIAMIGLALAAIVLPPPLAAAAAGLGFVLAGTAILFDAWLAYVMLARIGAVCLQCVATYVVNVLLALAFWRLESRPAAPPDLRALFFSRRAPLARLAIAAFVVGGIGTAVFVTQRELGYLRQFAREETLEFLDKVRQPPEIDMTRFAGLPARGPADAPLTIAVVGDFECRFCRALAAHVERLRARYPGKIREIFVNAPVSSDCNPAIKENLHEHACTLAEMGVCAARLGKFWEFHDALYQRLPQPRVTAENAARLLPSLGIDPDAMLRCFADSALASATAPRAQVARDVELCRELQLTDVPSVVINGHARRGGVYPAMLDAVVRAMLASR